MSERKVKVGKVIALLGVLLLFTPRAFAFDLPMWSSTHMEDLMLWIVLFIS